VRRICVDCVGFASLVKGCMGDKLFDSPCPFYPYRLSRGRPSVKLIRRYCVWCMGGHEKDVRECSSATCPAKPYRMGRNPAMAGRKPSGGQLTGRFPLKNRKVEAKP
jgi:hypothetical protein